ncbi:N-acetyltransferase [Taibaiella koreensis]|uniref:N-acetyltransferase n=1 Tax=Taibaiella koreensis TaxID=1268548 RepID=UPI000E59E967|nr:N-acetyltransferase [Taibaiella koreensis]
MSIITKFTVATEQGVETLLKLTQALATEKFSSLIDRHTLDRYIVDHYNEKALIGALNNRSNQWLVVYVDSVPAGYACITTRGQKPEALAHRRAIRIADFGILKQYPDPAVGFVLLEKCLAVCKSGQDIAVWINEYIEYPLAGLFEAKGFIRQPGTYRLDELPLAAACWIV